MLRVEMPNQIGTLALCRKGQTKTHGITVWAIRELVWAGKLPVIKEGRQQ